MSDGGTERQSPRSMSAYRRLWTGTVAMALANRCERLAVGWFVLMTTDSVFLTAAAFAVQKVPTSLVAPLAGDISDRRACSRIAVFDALQWTLLQQHVPDERRGLVIGGWMFVISFGWIGQLAMGALGQVIGVNWALGGAGCVVVLTGVAVLLCSARLRSASDHFVPQRGN